MNNHHKVGHFKNRLMIVLLSLTAILVMAGQSFAATICSSCHGMPPRDSVDGSRQPSTGAFKGSHQKHMGATATDAECTKCHGNSGYTSSHSKISGNMIQMNSNINNSVGGTYDKTAPIAQSTDPVLASCSNVNCHFEKNTTTRTPAPVWGTTPAVDCSFCHAYPPATASHSKHLGVFTGTPSKAITCSTCHPDYGTTSFSHATSAGKQPIKVNMTNQYVGVGVTNISWLPSQSKNYGSCNQVSCHSNGKGVYDNNPTWGAPNTTGCNFCHPNLSAGHSTHINNLAGQISFYNYTATASSGTVYKFGCANCHPFTTASHIDGTVEVDLTNNVAGGHLKNLNGAGATINGSKQCLNVYCHSNGYAPLTYATTPIWGSTFTGDRCAACHGNSPNSTIVGSSAHSAHVVGIHYEDIFNGVSKKLIKSGGQAVNAAHGAANRSTTINCNICHAATVSASWNDKNTLCSGCHNGTTAPLKGNAAISDTSKHVNGAVDVVFINQKIATKAQLASSAFAGYTSGNSGGWSRNSNAMPFKTYTTSYDITKANLAAVATYSQAAGCSNVACHANIIVKWTDAVTCTSCHTRLK